MKNLSYQLYSSRNHPPIESTLQMLSGLGYKEVEGFGGFYHGMEGSFQDLDKMKAALAENGLSMLSGHFGFGELEDNFEASVNVAKKLGMKSIYCPWLEPEERPNDVQGWQQVGKRLAALRILCNDAGLEFGWHNHDYEYFKLPDGTLPMEHIFAQDDKLQWEADLAWVVVGKGSIEESIERWGDRITAVHIKDIAPQGECADEDGWADIGHGTLDWDDLLKKVASCPVRHLVCEHDLPKDDRRFATRSMETLKTCSALQG